MIENPENNLEGKIHRRKGGAYDTLAKTLKGISEILFGSGIVMRNRNGTTRAEGANTDSTSVFETYHQNAPKAGFYNLLFLGTDGLHTEEKLNTNVIELTVNSKSESVHHANGIARMNISRDGELLAPNIAIFDLRTTSDTTGVTSQISGQDGGAAQLVYYNSAGTVTDYLFVDENGVQGLGDYQNVSDERTKKDISNLSYGLEEIKRLRPILFRRKGGVLKIVTPDEKTKDAPDKEKLEIGLIAQEVKEVIPEVVSGSEEKLYSIAYASLVPVLINAIKELSDKIDEKLT